MKTKVRGINVAALAALTAVLVATGPGSVFAKKPDKPSQPASVIAHVPLQGAVASQMYLQAQGDKRYLYIDQGTPGLHGGGHHQAIAAEHH